jgi:hypothetical protein
VSVSAGSAWTTVSDVVAVLRKRWARGQYLRSYAAAEPWAPFSLPVRGPAARELLDRLDEVELWLRRFEQDCRSRSGRSWLRIDYKTTTGRDVGRNDLPVRVWVDSFEDLVALLGVSGEVRRLEQLLSETDAVVPELRDWVTRHPQQAIEHADVWSRLLATTAWIRSQETTPLYLRQIDVAGVDTKFVETYQLILAELLEQLLPPERIDLRFGRGAFAGRFGFRRRPDYTRFRFLAPQSVFPAGISEATLRADEFTTLDPDCSTVILVENEISYLALPELPDTLAIFGAGFALGSVAGLQWLQDKRIIYWGDIDTYGFAILNRLRANFSEVESTLMDVDTLLAHRVQWVDEPKPTQLVLPHLTEAESVLYRDLVEDRYGHHVRLEQERVRFSLVRGALGALF